MDKIKNKKVGLILGAGFSHVAGIPLTKDIFNSDMFVVSKASEKRVETVWNAWKEWSKINESSGAEQFLDYVYCGKVNVPWNFAVEFVGIVLATSRDKELDYRMSPRYQGRLTSPVRSEVHKEFWDRILQLYDISCVVTTNYDLLIERGLRHRKYKRPYRPGFYYGGFDLPQSLKGQALPFYCKEQNKIIELNDGIPIFKVHGSLNWSIENGKIGFYQDMRPAFRHNGDSAIIPPLIEKKVPHWLKSVWRQSEFMLSNCSTWIVCGYSMPEYDVAINRLLENAVRKGNVDNLFLLDPYSQQIKARWQKLSGNLKIICCQGLPEALEKVPLIK